MLITYQELVNDMFSNINQTSSMLTVREVSQLLHVHSNTLRRWTEQGIIRAYRIGPRGDRRFRAADIAVLLLEDNKGINTEIFEQARLTENEYNKNLNSR